MPRSHDKSYFHFTRKERNGILLLTGLAILSTCVSIIQPYLFKSKPSSTHPYSGDIARLEIQSLDSTSSRVRYKKEFTSSKPYSRADVNYHGDLFYFDPNTISESEWKRLGLRDKTIGIIKNYLAKGGRFREADDIKKIWGLPEKLAERIIPYARIINRETPFKKDFPRNEFKRDYPTKIYEYVNINEGDTAALTKLPGIGAKLSQRIIKYRDRLGGFYKVEQVAETFGLPDSTFKKIRPWLKVEKDNIRTININTATIDELKVHPYIRYHLANALVQYRNQHKVFTSVSEIRNIMLVDDTTFRKVAPYLAVE